MVVWPEGWLLTGICSCRRAIITPPTSGNLGPAATGPVFGSAKKTAGRIAPAARGLAVACPGSVPAQCATGLVLR